MKKIILILTIVFISKDIKHVRYITTYYHQFTETTEDYLLKKLKIYEQITLVEAAKKYPERFRMYTRRYKSLRRK